MFFLLKKYSKVEKPLQRKRFFFSWVLFLVKSIYEFRNHILGFIIQPFKQISIFWIVFYLKKHVFVWRYSNDAIDLFYYP